MPLQPSPWSLLTLAAPEKRAIHLHLMLIRGPDRVI